MAYLPELLASVQFLASAKDKLMPPLETKTFRVRADQKIELDSDRTLKDRSSYLIRALLDIFKSSARPGLDIITLRNSIRLPDDQFKQLNKRQPRN